MPDLSSWNKYFLNFKVNAGRFFFFKNSFSQQVTYLSGNLLHG